MPDITEETIRELAAFKGEAPVTSVYLDVDGRRLLHQQHIEQELDSILKPARVRANGHSPGVSQDLDRIEAFVHGGFERSNTRGLAIFSCATPEFWRVVPLPTPVRSRVVVNNQAAIGELKAVVEQSSPLGVLLVDRQRARMFVFALGELVEQTEHFDELPRDVDARARAERSDHANYAADRVDQHLHRAAQLAFDTLQQVGFDHFATNAPDEFTPKLRELFHPYLRDRFCGRIAVQPSATTEEIRRAAMDVAERVEHEREAAVVQQMIAGVPTGGAVEGLIDTLSALNDHRVDTLVVSRGYEQVGWHCHDCDRVAAKGRACQLCGNEMAEVHDVVEEAIETCMARSGKVEMVDANPDLDVHGRIGALLRY